MSATATWGLLTFEAWGAQRLRLRRVGDGTVVRESVRGELEGCCGLHVSHHSATALAELRQGGLARIDLATMEVARLRLPPGYSQVVCWSAAGVIAVGDGSSDDVVAVMPQGEIMRLPWPYSAWCPDAEGFLVVRRLSADRAELGRLHLRTTVPEYDAMFDFEAGPAYPIRLGLVKGGNDEFITQQLPSTPDFEPPWIVAVGPNRPPRPIARAWFDPEVVTIRDNTLLHRAGFGARSLWRLRLEPGAAPEAVFGEKHRPSDALADPEDEECALLALSPDGALGLVPGKPDPNNESDGFPCEARDVATGSLLGAFVLPPPEIIRGVWMAPVGNAP